MSTAVKLAACVWVWGSRGAECFSAAEIEGPGSRIASKGQGRGMMPPTFQECDTTTVKPESTSLPCQKILNALFRKLQSDMEG